MFKAEATTVLPFESKVFLSSLLAPACATHPTNSASEVGLCLPSAEKKQTVCQGQPGVLGMLSVGPMRMDVCISSVRLLEDRIQRDPGCLGMSCSFPFLPLGKRQVVLLVCFQRNIYTLCAAGPKYFWWLHTLLVIFLLYHLATLKLDPELFAICPFFMSLLILGNFAFYFSHQ